MMGFMVRSSATSRLISRSESDGVGEVRSVLRRIMVICPTTHVYSNAHVGYFTHTHIDLRKEDAI